MRTNPTRRLEDLAGVGPAALEDFRLLGISSVDELARHEPQELYDKLCALTGSDIDPCCLDVFTCAVAQAQDPHLPDEQRQWWYWSRLRKGGRSS